MSTGVATMSNLAQLRVRDSLEPEAA